MKQKYTIKHIRLLINGRFELLPKCFGVELVELGFLEYQKLTPKNYYYWWYEVDNEEGINPKAFTYKWSDLRLTKKFDWIKKLIDYHNDDESIYNLIIPILNLESAKNLFDKETGKLDTDLIMELYYGNRNKQLQLMFDCV